MSITLDDLRRFAVSHSLFPPTTLERAINRLGFVQADPIRAPARAQDLTLRHRVIGYRAGDLERRYASLDVEEDVLVNYGFVPRWVQRLMHPRPRLKRWAVPMKQADAVLAFVRERRTVHPREVDAHFALGRVTNYWGGSSAATTHLMDEMHYCGLLRVVRREAGLRIYAAQAHAPRPEDEDADQALDALVDLVVGIYAPVPGPTLLWLVNRLRYAAPQWRGALKTAQRRAKQRLAHARIGAVDWYWPARERIGRREPEAKVRLLAPFDPVVWDRRRFELFWGWAYRFEAYTPVAKRKLGYYALPILWRDRAIGWANLSLSGGALQATFGYASGRAPREKAFTRELDAELERMRTFLEPARPPELSSDQSTRSRRRQP